MLPLLHSAPPTSKRQMLWSGLHAAVFLRLATFSEPACYIFEDDVQLVSGLHTAVKSLQNVGRNTEHVEGKVGEMNRAEKMFIVAI
jgi:hypothetical protein